MTCRRVKTLPSLAVWSAASQERRTKNPFYNANFNPD